MTPREKFVEAMKDLLRDIDGWEDAANLNYFRDVGIKNIRAACEAFMAIYCHQNHNMNCSGKRCLAALLKEVFDE